MGTTPSTKPLGEPIAGEDRGAAVTCPAGHAYGLYYHDVRNDFCLSCERRKARAGDMAARQRADRLAALRVAADKAQQFAADGARRLEESKSKGARWEPWERMSPRGFSMGEPLTRTDTLPAE